MILWRGHMGTQDLDPSPPKVNHLRGHSPCSSIFASCSRCLAGTRVSPRPDRKAGYGLSRRGSRKKSELRKVGCYAAPSAFSSRFEHRAPASGNRIVSRTVGLFERDSNVTTWFQIEGHVDQRVADPDRLHESPYAGPRLVGSECEGLGDRADIRFTGYIVPDRPVDALGIARRRGLEIDDQEVNLASQEFRGLANEIFKRFSPRLVAPGDDLDDRDEPVPRD